jgi:hypothetical protein
MTDDPRGAGMPSVLEYQLSGLVALASGAVPHCCASNAWRALICLPQIFFPCGEYIEGWIAYETQERVKVVEHCWCELAMDGLRRILDPSIVFLVEEGQPVWYFPGVRRSWRETELLEGEWFPHVLFESYGKDGLGHPGYRAAHDEAIAQGRALAQAAAPPKELAVHTAEYVPEEVLAALSDDTVYVVIVRDRIPPDHPPVRDH